ncbi:MAG: outer membrane protein transport protein [Melioribacteraceae bacterium]
MRKLKTLALSILLFFTLSTITFANGLSLNSVGTKALGMGGAFVGLANDATAIYWNPAGLAGQRSSVDLFFTGVMPLGSYKMDVAGIDATTESNLYPTGGLLGVYSADKLTFGLGVYVPAGLGAEWNGADLAVFSGGSAFDWESKIGVVAISPSIAYQVSDKFSIGLSANIYYAMFDLLRPDAADLNQDGIPETPVQYTEESTGLGYGATVGLKYDVNNKLSLGAAFRTSTSVTMDGTADIDVPGMGNIINTEFTRDVTWPMWISGGIAYKPTKCLTVALDVQYSNWAKLDKLVADYEKMPEGEFNLDWEDAVQIRFGSEYLVSPVTAIRLGYYYDPAPAPDETLNILFPSSNNHVVTAGFGHSFGKYRIDAAIEYLLGGDRDVEAYPVGAIPENMPGIHHLDVFAFSLGFGYAL